MNYHEMFRDLPPESQTALLGDLLAADKGAYAGAVASLAPAVNVRPVFVQRMPPAKRHAWLAKMLSRKSSDAVTGSIIQLWLGQCRRDMLRAFLDQLGVQHNDGMLESLPDSPPKGKLKPAVDHLLANHPRHEVILYLQAFQAMGLASWPELDELLQKGQSHNL